MPSAKSILVSLAVLLGAAGCATTRVGGSAPRSEEAGTGGSGDHPKAADEMPRTGDDQSAVDEGGFSEIPTQGD